MFATFGEIPRDIDQFLLLNMDGEEDNGYSEILIAQSEAEWMFLTDHLGWKQGLQGDESEIDQEPEYLFTTEQMNWKKGLKVSEKKERKPFKRNCSRFTIWRVFNPSTGMNSPKRRGQRLSSTSCI